VRCRRSIGPSLVGFREFANLDQGYLRVWAHGRKITRAASWARPGLPHQNGSPADPLELAAVVQAPKIPHHQIDCAFSTAFLALVASEIEDAVCWVTGIMLPFWLEAQCRSHFQNYTRHGAATAS
jgi:hypothetical protein